MTRNALFRAGAACAVLLLAFALPAQGKRPVTHDDYDGWKSLRGATYSLDGKWVAYQIEPQWGDGVMEVRQTEGSVVHRYDLGQGPRFSADGRFVVFNIGKSKVEERQKKIEEAAKKAAAAEKGEGEGEGEGAREAGRGGGEPANRRAEMAQRFGQGPRGAGRRGPGGGGPGGDGGSSVRGDMGVLDLSTGKVEVIKRVKGFQAPDEIAVLVYHLDSPEAVDEEKKEGEEGEKQEGEKPAEKLAVEPGEKLAVKPAEKPAVEPGEKPAEKPAVEPGEKPAEKPAVEPEARTGAPRGGRTRPGGTGEGRPGGGGEGRRGGGGRRPGGGPAAAATPVDPLEKKRKDGTVLVVRDLGTGQERRFEHVVSYGTTRKATWLWYHTSAKKPDPKDTHGLFAVKLAGGEPIAVVQGFADFNGITADREETGLAFASNLEDFAAEKPRFDLYLWSFDAAPASRIVHAGTAGLPADKTLSTGGLSFCRDGSVLEFALQDPPEPPAPEILADDQVMLDLWHWNDGTIQTAQARGRGRTGRTWSAVWHRTEQRLVVLGDDDIQQVRFINPDGSRAIATDGKPYEKLTTWDGSYNDVYLVNTMNGARTKVLERLRGNVTNSPSGRYLTWFDQDEWSSFDVATGERRNLTEELSVAFQREEDDHPHPDPAHGIAGWTADDATVVLYDEFDLWQISPRTGEAACITDGLGRATRHQLRYLNIDRDEEYLPSEMLLSAVNLDTMSEAVYRDWLDAVRKPHRLFQQDKNIDGITKAKNADRFFFNISTFREYGDLWTAGAGFAAPRRLTDTNPQQKDFAWGDAELVHWVDADGKSLQGILVKPDGFDPKKQYPMMVYFYEKMSRNLHRYVTPSPGTSPNASYYVSNGYLFFMPDITYEVGYPGASCLKCVVSGVQHLIAKGFVDPKAIGAAGHSWGGYQTAYLVTRTNIFTAVESGAPVSNMISAYGGIRYSSGVSRQFQYEQTQSRIGGTPWEYPMRFWENSPIFFADKVNTPVLMLHNDQDGAVPWTQGIEYFMALRRLGKEAYLFNYTGENHGLAKRQNQKDWSRRMSEYFGHHLRGDARPKWMEEGVPFSDREKEKLPHAPSLTEISKAIDKIKKETAEKAAAAAAEASTEAAEAGATEATAEPGKEAVKEPAKEVSGETAPPGGTGSGGETTGAVETAAPPAPRRGGRTGRRPGGGGSLDVAPGSTDRAANPKGQKTMLQEGSQAPDFAVPDETGKERTLSEFAGKTVVLWFYPKADTPG